MDAFRKLPIRKLNPGLLQSDKDVREQFVVRKHEFAIVLEVLRGNIEASSCQHVLVVAPRGRGKTMLLARVAAELHTDAVLSERLLPVRFMEESQEVFNLADFWLETLFHLARESAEHNPELARELRETHADLIGRWNEETLGERAFAAVLRAANRLGKQLVLMVENLQALCDTVDNDFGWKLREVLQSEPQIMLLATATSRFKKLDDAQQPFFELFRTVDLESLSTEECRELWQVISGDAVSKREMRPLEILTGGSPRLLVIVAGFGQHRSLLQLMEELVTLIDEHTEYFRNNMEVLAKTERRVYIAVIDLWQPSTTGQIAARARLDVRTASTMLGRLADRGAVIWKGSGRKRQYVAAERLYSIYYKLRRERDEAAVVQNLIRFMVAFYSEAELAEMSGEFIAEAAQSQAIREGIERAVAELPELDRIFSGMRRPVMDEPQPAKAELSMISEEPTLSGSLTVTDTRSAERLLQVLLTAFNEEAFEKVIEIADQAFTAWSTELSHGPESLIARAFLIEAMAYQKLGDSQTAIAAYDEAIVRFGASEAPEVQVSVGWALSSKGEIHRERGEFAEAIAAYDELVTRFGASETPEVQMRVAWALGSKGEIHRECGEFVEAIATYDEVVVRFGASETPEILERVTWALCGKGRTHCECGEFIEAIAIYDELVTRFGASEAPEVQVSVGWALGSKGEIHRERGEFVEAIAIYDEVVVRFGASETPEVQVLVAWALSSKGEIHRERGEFVEAIAIYDEVVVRFGASETPEVQARVAWALSSKGEIHRERGELAEAIAAYDELVTRFGASETPEVQVPAAWALSSKGGIHQERGEFAEAIATYDEAIVRFGASEVPEVQVPVGWALYDEGRTRRERGEFAEAIAAYDELVTRFGASDTPQLQVRVGWTLYDKGRTHRECGEFARAIAAYDELVTRFGTSDTLQLQGLVAWALCDKGGAHREYGEFAGAIATYDELLTHFGTSDTPEFQEPIAWALYGKGEIHRECGEFAAAVAVYDELLTHFGTSDTPAIQLPVAWALCGKGWGQTGCGHVEEALHTCEELEQRLATSTGSEKAMFEWQVRCIRTKALLVQKNSRAAMEAFRSAYAVFAPDNRMMMSGMIRFVPDLIATGASVPDLIEILSSDKAKSDALEPLNVALREYHTGEAERAPEEVREVAADIIEQIEQRIEARASKEGSSVA